MRRKTKDDVLAKRAKDILRRWRDMILPTQEQITPQHHAHHPHQHQTNGAGFTSRLSSPMLDKRPISIGDRRLSPGLPIPSPAQSLSPVDLGKRSPAVPYPPTTLDHVSQSSLKRHFQDVSPRVNHTIQPHSDPVPRTHAANKRLRKDPQRLNGQTRPHEDNSRDSFGSGSVEIISVNQVPIETKVVNSEPRKRGRKKLKKNATGNVSQDEVKEKIASIARTPKVKTTKELLAGLKAHKEEKPSLANCLPLPNIDELEMTRSKTEHIARFLREAKSEPTSVVAEEPEPNPTTSTSNLSADDTINAIMARLPPIDYSVLDHLDDDDYPYSKPEEPTEVTDEHVTRLLSEQVEGLNGTRHEGELRDEEDTGFREWHEMVSKKSYLGGDLLHILPYVVID